MHLNRDIFNKIEIPQILLASPSKQILGEIINFKDLNVKLNLNDIDTVSFKVFRTKEHNEIYDQLEDLKLVLVRGYGWFQIRTALESNGVSEYINVTGQSIEVELGQQYLVNFEINTGEILYEDYDYEPVKFYNPHKPSASLLHKILTTSNWTIGHVDIALWEMQRSFDVDERDIYSFLTSEVGEAFKCMFIFNTFERTINAFVINDYGQPSGLYVCFENLMKDLSINVDVDAIKTCFRVEGGEGININDVNPNGTNIIYNPGYYLSWMRQDIQDCYNLYKTVYDSELGNYKTLMAQYRTLIDELYELKAIRIDNLNSTDYSLFGLRGLQKIEESCLDIESGYIEQGFGDSTHKLYSTLYLPNHNELLRIQAEIIVRNNQIKSKETEIKNNQENRAAINQILKIENFFTEEQWKEVISFQREYTYRNDNFIKTDIMTDQEILSIEQELYDLAVEELAKVCEPKYSFTASLLNLFAMKTFDAINDDIELGNYILVEVRPDYIAKLRLISIGIDFNNVNNLEVTFSDMTRMRTCYEDTADVLAQASAAATTLGIYISQMLQDCDKASDVHQIMENGLNTANTMITTSKDQDIVIDQFGIWLRKYSRELLGYEPEQIRMINNLICFSDDGFRSTQMALGKIYVNDIWTYGLMAPALVGKIMMTETLYIGNVNNTFTIDKDGLFALNADGTLAVCMNPNRTKGLIEIIKNYKLNNEQRLFYTDDKGNLNLTGTLTASTVNGSTINGGTIRGTDIYGAYIEGTKIKGGEIDGAIITSSKYDYGTENYKEYRTKIEGGNIEITGQGNYFKNSGTFESKDSEYAGTYDAEVQIKNGTMLIKGMNSYIRGMNSRSGNGYYKMIGISAESNLVIGHRGGDIRHGYHMTDDPETTGCLDSLPLKIYARDVDLALTVTGEEVWHKLVTDKTLEDQKEIKDLYKKIEDLNKDIKGLVSDIKDLNKIVGELSSKE